MARQKVDIDGLADAVMEGLTEYADLATDNMKTAVKKAGNTVKKDISANGRSGPGGMQKAGVPRRRKNLPPLWK